MADCGCGGGASGGNGAGTEPVTFEPASGLPGAPGAPGSPAFATATATGAEMGGFFESLSAQTGLDPSLIRGIIIGVILFLVARGL